MNMDMPMGSTLPEWLTPVAWTYLTLSVLSAAVIAADIHLGRRRHHGIASELVWIASGLYLGPFAIALYLSRGRTDPAAGDTTPRRRADTVVALLPGGGASAVAHLIAVPFVVAVGWTIAGLAMWPMVVVIAILAVVMVAVYELVASTSVHPGRARTLSVGSAIVAAAVTVGAFDVGMVGWMLLLHVNNAMPPVTEGTFWFLMQVGVIVGLLTAYPAVAWLLSRRRTVVPS